MRRASQVRWGSQAKAKNQPAMSRAPSSDIGATPSSSNSQPTRPSGMSRTRPKTIAPATSSRNSPQKRTAGPRSGPPVSSTTRLGGSERRVTAFTPGSGSDRACVRKWLKMPSVPTGWRQRSVSSWLPGSTGRSTVWPLTCRGTLVPSSASSRRTARSGSCTRWVPARLARSTSVLLTSVLCAPGVTSVCSLSRVSVGPAMATGCRART